jgi:hypothetical protein
MHIKPNLESASLHHPRTLLLRILLRVARLYACVIFDYLRRLTDLRLALRDSKVASRWESPRKCKIPNELPLLLPTRQLVDLTSLFFDCG